MKYYIIDDYNYNLNIGVLNTPPKGLFSLYQIRTDTCCVKGSCTTIILKNLNCKIATQGIEPHPSAHEADVRTFTQYHCT